MTQVPQVLLYRCIDTAVHDGRMVVRALQSLLVLIAIATVIAALIVRWRQSTGKRSAEADPSRGRRRLARWICGALGIAAAVAVSLAIGQRAIFLIVPLAVTAYVVGLLVGELIMPPAGQGPLRHGSLERRSVQRYLDYKWPRGWRFLTVTAVGAIVVAGLAGAPDGRSLSLACANDTIAGSSPWPGWSFGAPALIVLLIGALLVEISIHRAVNRPRPDATVIDAVTDDAMRATSIRRAIAAGMAIVLAPLAGVTVSAAMILSFICSSAGALGWTGPLAVALAVVGSGATIGAAVALAWLLQYREGATHSPTKGARDSVQQWS